MSTAELRAAVATTVARLPAGALSTLVAGLRAGRPRTELRDAVPTAAYRAAVGALLDAWPHAGGVTPDALALALECARDQADLASGERVSVVWTGPSTEAVAVRRTDQALLEVIAAARRRLIVVSYAVFKVAALQDALVAAAARGVKVDLVLEEAAGQHVGPAVRDACGLLTWPLEDRPLPPTGGTAALHAKCAVADRERLLVTSANLTDYAQTINMELGLLVTGGPVPGRVQKHLEALIQEGRLAPLGAASSGA